MAVFALHPSAASPKTTAADGRSQRLRAACDELVGTVLFGQMLRQQQQSCLNSSLFHSHAEDVFQQQLDDELVKRSSAGMGGSLSKALYEQLSGPAGRSARPAGAAGKQAGTGTGKINLRA